MARRVAINSINVRRGVSAFFKLFRRPLPWRTTSKSKKKTKNNANKQQIPAPDTPLSSDSPPPQLVDTRQFFRFTRLPIELQLDIIDLIHDQYTQRNPQTEGEDHPAQPNTLVALASVSRFLRDLCSPILFSSLQLRKVDIDRLQNILESGPSRRVHVKELAFILTQDSDSFTWEQGLNKLIPTLPNVQSLTILHDREDTTKRPVLACLVARNFEKLRHVTMEEVGFDPEFSDFDHPNVEAANTFLNCFLSEAILGQEGWLDGHAEKLESLTLRTLLPIQSSVYVAIRDKCPALRSVVFTTNIALDLRELWAEDKVWASGRNGQLESITVHECGGVHVGYLARNLLQGVYGNHLKELNVVACGHPTDELYVPLPYSITREKGVPSNGMHIKHLHVDHLGPWELQALSLVDTFSIAISRMPEESLVELTNLIASPFQIGDEFTPRESAPQTRGGQGVWPGGGGQGFSKVQALKLTAQARLQIEKQDGGEDLQEHLQNIIGLWRDLADRGAKKGAACSWDARHWGDCPCHPWS